MYHKIDVAYLRTSTSVESSQSNKVVDRRLHEAFVHLTFKFSHIVVVML